jgi:hypothetical protein
MNKSLGVFWLSLSAVGSLISMIAIPGFAMVELVGIVFAIIVYSNYELRESKKKFVVICSINFFAGCGLYWMPHDERGGLGGLGIFLALFVLVPSTVFLAKIYKAEVAEEKKILISSKIKWNGR